MTEDTLRDWLMLALTPNIGPVSFLKLINHFGNASKALHAQEGSLKSLLTKNAIYSLINKEAEASVDQALQWAENEDCSLMTLYDDDYPIALAHGQSPPPILFLRGKREILSSSMFAIVGSRHATPQALQTAKSFAKSLSESDFTIVSGFAAGIDTAAHQGALQGSGRTVGVLGTGIDRIYPARNKEMAHQMVKTGLLISEFPLGMQPLAGNFPRRNRIIAALSHSTLVVEAALESGSLITARLANEMGKNVMAIPGSIHNPQSKGCHQLIKDGAKLIDNINDILEELSHLIKVQPTATKSLVLSEPKENVHPLLIAMGFDPIHPDSLAQKLNMGTADVYADLIELELEGKISLETGGRFQRITH